MTGFPWLHGLVRFRKSNRLASRARAARYFCGNFKVAKIMDYRDQLEALLEETNPFAPVERNHDNCGTHFQAI
ncbi:hypothetical protein Thiosp_03968 [Thiorhodovibrio litoralis]|nr:hypothetical protein Thiosp_03968 [Thiorhodovibrio litoralis]